MSFTRIRHCRNATFKLSLRNRVKCQARIQEFSSGGGGVQLLKMFDKQKKKKKKKAERKRKAVVVLSLLQKYGLNRLSRQLFTFKFIFRKDMFLYNCKPLST